MFNNQIDKMLFLDIETVSGTASLLELSVDMQALWTEKFVRLQSRMPDKYDKNITADEAYEKSAAIYAEFAKIVCISVGFIYYQNQAQCFRVKSFASDNEKHLLEEFSQMLNKFMLTPSHYIAGHNIKEFDIPFICRRMLVNGITIPSSINVAGKKPWETSFIDTLDLWKFGDLKSYASLKLMTTLFGIPTSKDDIDGSMVGEVYYKENDLQRIALYCEKDVIATAQLYLRLRGLDVIEMHRIEHVP